MECDTNYVRAVVSGVLGGLADGTSSFRVRKGVGGFQYLRTVGNSSQEGRRMSGVGGMQECKNCVID